MIKKLKNAVSIACFCGCCFFLESHQAKSNDQSLMKEKFYSNNKEYIADNESQLNDLLGLPNYPEKRTLLDSIDVSLEHERLRKKMLAN